MSPTFNDQSSKTQHTDPVTEARNTTHPMQAAARFERYKVLIRKLAHHMSGTGEAMTKAERSELHEITKWEPAP